MYNDELQFEADFIKSLQENGWSNGILKNPTEKDLLNNWAKILFENNRQQDRLSDYPLTDTEMQQIIDKINELKYPVKLNSFINGKTISIVRDNPDDLLHKGKEISLKIYDRQEIAAGQSRYQIAEQPVFNKKSPILNDRRGDIMLLINGMPLFHIELKKSNIEIKEATNQIEKYAHEGIFSSGIYQLVQIFAAITPDEALYFANPGPDSKFNPLFFFHWEDFNNEIINNWKDITRTLLSIPMAHQLIGFYTVADDTDNTLKVMRSYQYYAANKISDVVAKIDWTNPNTRGGYIWHTTGSGKTMTSFKSAQLIANSKDADKVVFLMDRIELGTQSLDEYQNFADNKDDVSGTTSTKDLITQMKDDHNILIVTSIQKMSLIKSVLGIYTHDIELINKKRIVFIVDECHRDTFGTMMSTIKETFPKAVFFGFTGTPVFDENKKKMSVTSDIFGNELHRYVIADGIRDGNVLAFDIKKILTFKDSDLRKSVALEKCKAKNEDEALSDPTKSKLFYKFMNEVPMAGDYNESGEYIKGIEDYIPKAQYNNPIHRERVVESILENWKIISHNNEFSGLLATSSIQEAIEYYRLLKNKNAQDLFKFTILVDPNIDNTDGAIFKEDGLVEIIDDYNKIYEHKFSLSTASTLKKDISNRLAHKKPYTNISEKDKLGLLIVVDQMLTGFDSKWLNVLYMDKVIKYESVIQAISRTNRIYNKNTKPFGIIKYYRKPHTMQKNIEKAVKLYSGDKPFQLYVPKLAENINQMNLLYAQIEDLFQSDGINNFSSLPTDNESKRKFVKLYNEFNKYLCAAKIQGYIPKEENNKGVNFNNLLNNNLSVSESKEIYNNDYNKNNIHILESPITISSLEALKQRYVDVSKIQETNKNIDIPYDIDGSLIEIDDGRIDSDYINSKFTKFLKVLKYNDCTEEELEKALNNLHKSFAGLPQEQQKYANMIIHDIESGDLSIEENKTFMDYITQYQTSAENDQIRKLSNAFELDETKLRNMMILPINGKNLNEYGRFDDLLKSVNFEVAKQTLEKIYDRPIEIWETYMEVQKILREFILKGGFDLNSLSEKDR